MVAVLQKKAADFHHPVSCSPIIAKLLFSSSSTKASFRTSQLSFGSSSWVCILMLKDATFHPVIGFKATESLLTLDQRATKRHKQLARFCVWARNSCKVECLGLSRMTDPGETKNRSIYINWLCTVLSKLKNIPFWQKFKASCTASSKVVGKYLLIFAFVRWQSKTWP